jgi:hypothetical protein
VDTVADKGIFHKNKAARDKSRLSAKVKALATAGRLTIRQTARAGSAARRLKRVRCQQSEKPPSGGFFMDMPGANRYGDGLGFGTCRSLSGQS